MRAAIGSQCKLINRGVTCILFGSLKMYLAAAFWINGKGLIELAGRPAKRALQSVMKQLLKCHYSIQFSSVLIEFRSISVSVLQKVMSYETNSILSWYVPQKFSVYVHSSCFKNMHLQKTC